MNNPDIVVPVCFAHTDTATCTLPWYVHNSQYDPAMATYEPLVNGEETFKAVHLAIAAAVKSVDIICWGFQPSMFFVRDGRAPSIGELLKIKAREGVSVRILTWEMPLNLAGAGGEANLPGKGSVRIGGRALQSSTPEQYAQDREWFKAFAVADNKAIDKVKKGVPVLVSRGFSWEERRKIGADVKRSALDTDISSSTRYAHMAAPSHHQKSVIVDYEAPEVAVGFVMGHNMLDEYWDTDAHSARNRTPQTLPAPDRGPRGKTPRQDISSRVTGPILAHLHHNFATAWLKETGEDLFATRPPMQAKADLRCAPGGRRQLAQLLRTQPQEGRKEIQEVYLKAANNATQFIYLENQYFRWPPLAELIKKVASTQAQWGRDPGQHGSLHLFVVTNATADGIGPGAVNTQRMLESLGRAETIPEVTKLRRIQAVKRDAPPKPRPEPRDMLGQMELSRWQASMDEKIKAIEDEALKMEDIPNLKVHVCSLVAPDSPAGQDWVPVYIHSKLMIVDDVFTTHGSANINTRSMQVDSELNIAHEWASVTEALRRRLWGLHTGWRGAQDDAGVAFKEWGRIIKKNKEFQTSRMSPYTSLVEFLYADKSLKDLD